MIHSFQGSISFVCDNCGQPASMPISLNTPVVDAPNPIGFQNVCGLCGHSETYYLPFTRTNPMAMHVQTYPHLERPRGYLSVREDTTTIDYAWPSALDDISNELNRHILQNQAQLIDPAKPRTPDTYKEMKATAERIKAEAIKAGAKYKQQMNREINLL